MRSGRFSAALTALMLAVAAAASPARAADPLDVDFYVDVADDDLAEAAATSQAAPGGELLIAGIPLRIGTRDEAASGGWRMVAGGNGRYVLPITGRLTMTGRANISRTNFVDDRDGKSFALAATDFRYAHDGWVLGVQPSVEVTRWDTEVVEQYAGVEARVSRALTDRLSLASTGRYRWRTVTGGGAAPDLEIAFGRVGLACKLPEGVRLDVAYVVRQEIAAPALDDGEPSVTRGTGPSVALVLPGVGLPLGGRVDVSVNYDYTATTRYQGAADGKRQDLHRLGVGAKWDIGGSALDMDFSASYRLEHHVAPAGHEDDAHHAGRVSVALTF